MLTWQGVADAVVELLAEDAGVSSSELREALSTAGSALPVDSLLIVEILERVEERFGVRVPETVEATRNFTSVQAFAQLLVDVMSQHAVVAGGGAA